MKLPFVTKCLFEVAPQIGAQVIPEPEYGFVGQILFKNGKQSLFKNSFFSLNTNGATTISNDKGYSYYFLKKMGFVIPKTQTFFNTDLNEKLTIKRGIDEGYEYAKTLGFPVIVKPNDGSWGRGVAKVHNKADFFQFANTILSYSEILLVQEFCLGKDYRIVVLDDKVHCAYERIPLSITGDGESTLNTLLQTKQITLQDSRRLSFINLSDPRMLNKLQKKGLTLDSILPDKERISLLDNANLSNGGMAIDWSDKIHPSYKILAINITKAMGLRLCGVDIMTADITQPVDKYHVIEINSAPGLHNYAALGEQQLETTKRLYLDILRILERA
ncbi:MAG: cyanophycin synthetase [Saprospiraceae bacterium]